MQVSRKMAHARVRESPGASCCWMRWIMFTCSRTLQSVLAGMWPRPRHGVFRTPLQGGFAVSTCSRATRNRLPLQGSALAGVATRQLRKLLQEGVQVYSWFSLVVELCSRKLLVMDDMSATSIASRTDG